MHPTIGIDSLGGFFRVVPVTQHDGVATGAIFPLLAARQGLAIGADDTRLCMGVDAADGGDAFFKRVVRVEADLRGEVESYTEAGGPVFQQIFIPLV